MVPCTGREYHQELSRQWAESLTGQLVLVPFLKDGTDGKSEWITVPGLAMPTIFRGGWYGLKIYISVDKAPNWGNFNLQRHGFDEEYDIIDDHKLYYIPKGKPNSKDIVPIRLNEACEELREILKLTGAEAVKMLREMPTKEMGLDA